METLRKLFRIWNEQYFQNKIVNVSLFTYTRRCGRMGYYKFSYRGKGIYVNQNQSTAAQQHTLLHEMVHAYLHACNLKHGHTPMFKSMLTSLTIKAFGFYPVGSISHVIAVKNEALALTVTKEVPRFEMPTVTIAAPVPAPIFAQRYRILSNGKVGTFLKECVIYGKKHVVLTNVEGCLFPFTAPMDGVRPC
jgi:hypothetical protein